MFLLTVFAYPAALALLLTGAGLLVDRLAGGTLPGRLLPVTGAAALIAASQVSTDIPGAAPLTPYLIATLALAGFALQRARLRACGRGWLAVAAGMALVYLIAIAPVLLSGRASFSSYMVLTDSAVHLVGAQYLLTHGQFFSHLELHNSFGEVVSSYFNTGYPSGADTLFGGSVFLMGLPLIWAFQPFNALILATAVGPAWLLARRAGLPQRWAAAAAITATLPALVYAYELIASVKEIVALPMILAIGALIVDRRRWLMGSSRGAIPLAVVFAAGISALGIGFGAWALASAAVLAGAAVLDPHTRRALTARHAAAVICVGAAVMIVCAWPTWAHIGGSIAVAHAIATTANPGNLQSPLQAVQLLGVWLSGSYMTPPLGAAASLTEALMWLCALAAALGAAYMLRSRRWALAAWLAAMMATWVALTEYGTTWVDAKGLVLTSPIVALCAWAGVASLRRVRLLRPASALLALALMGGVLASDAIQYHSSDLAPTGRYEEMAALSRRFAGRGPTLFADFDEYSMYEMRALNVGGPDFLYPPATLLSTSAGHGHTVSIDHASPAALRAYPLVITRRDPAAPRPPSAYRLVYQGRYYQVWRRRARAPAAIADVGVATNHPPMCRRVAALARLAAADGARLVAATHPHIVEIGLRSARHPAAWTRSGPELVMRTPGALRTAFRLKRGGRFELWLKGEAMPTLTVRIDGRVLGALGGQLSGNGDSPDPIGPLRVRLAAGFHLLTIAREGFSLAPGNGGLAYLDSAFLAPAGRASAQRLLTVAPARWRTLCARVLSWIEVVRPAPSRGAALPSPVRIAARRPSRSPSQAGRGASRSARARTRPRPARVSRRA